jgi:DNA-binding MarR family transcriptional regulator
MAAKLPIATVQAWARLVRVQQQLLARVEADLKRAGLPALVWYDVLLELVRAPDGRLRHKELHGRMLLAKYNLSRLLDRMVDEGLVMREAVGEDGRGAYIAATGAGRDLQKRMWPVYEQAISNHFASRLKQADLRQLDSVLSKLREQ